jgi:predicted membrane protein
MPTSNFRMSFQVILGLIVIALGVIYTLDNLGIIYADNFTRFWPILIVLYGLSRIIQCEAVPQKLWGAFWVLVGGLWLLDRLNIIYFSIWELWPLILVVLGASLIWGRGRGHSRVIIGLGSVAGDSNSTINALAFMGGFKRSNDSQDFRGGEATAIMSGCEIDLRKASIKEGEAVLDLTAIMGGIEIWVPEDWKVTLRGIPLLGGFEDKTHPTGLESNKNLIVKGYAIMGGVEIKN